MRRAAIALPLGLAVMAQAPTATLDVTVQGVRSDRGHVRVAVCPKADFLAPRCPYRASAPSRAGSVTVPVAGIPPGVYAVQAFQDENDDGEIDRSLIGIPTEGIGFSRDAPFHFGPPSFADAAISIGREGGAVSLTLRYFR